MKTVLKVTPKKFMLNPTFTAVPAHVPPGAGLLQPPVVKVPSSFLPSLVVLKPGTIAAPKPGRANSVRAAIPKSDLSSLRIR
jgi:hypothetical protein